MTKSNYNLSFANELKPVPIDVSDTLTNFCAIYRSLILTPDVSDKAKWNLFKGNGLKSVPINV